MEVEKTSIDGLLILHPKVFEDNRGCFFESYNEKVFRQLGIDVKFVQENQSVSAKNVVRGLHLQAPPFAQGKLVRVAKGAALDFAVDIRKNSPTYGQYVAAYLSERNYTQFWIPEGFAHGFVAQEDDTVFVYKTTNFYDKSSEMAIRWDDPILNIDWQVKNPIVSEKDANNPCFADFVSPF
ncbi:MAG: dTDP-4-dehydrorhamnose 3,5-epimerase [Bacteroidales bacterium]|nr:dTDP-4-dehydrorhamnose 3,5-epimerase [Bacteroidales bacterium]